MGIRFLCPNGHKLNVKAFQAGRRGICPFCGAKFQIPSASTLQPNQSSLADNSPPVADARTSSSGGEVIGFEQNLEAHVQLAEQAASGQSSSATPAAWSAQSASPLAPSPTPAGEYRPVAAESGDPKVGVNPTAPVQDAPAPVETQSVAAPTAEAPPPSATDPLADTPHAVWYVRPPSGGQFGPAQADMMRGWLNEGRVSPETLVWREGWTDWQEAGSVFPQLQPASSTPEAPPVAGGDPTSSYRTGPRRRKNGPSIGLIVVLVAAVLLLLVVLIWVLVIGPTETPSEQGSSMATLATPHRAARTSQIT